MKSLFGFATLVGMVVCLACVASPASAQAPMWMSSLSTPAPPCPPTGQSLPAPTNVRQLHPSQVAVVAALGDSITAAFALNNKPFEYRLWSWSIGAEEANVTATLANLIRNQNPKLQVCFKKTEVILFEYSFHSFFLKRELPLKLFFPRTWCPRTRPSI